MTENAPKLPMDREEQTVHLRDYWRIIWRHRWTVGAVFVGIVLLSGVYTFLQTPIYKATATVEAQTRARQAVSGPDVAALGAQGFGWAAEERFYSTQLEVIRSRDLARRVIDRLGLHDDPMLADVPQPDRVLSSMVRADLRHDTGIIEISLTGPDPEKIASLANAFAEEYVKRNLQLGRGAVQQMVAEMEDLLEPLKREFQNKEAERLEFAEKSEIFVPENQQSILERSLQEYSRNLAEVNADIARYGGIVAKIDQLRASGGDPLTIPELSEDSAMSQLVVSKTGLEQSIERLKVRYRAAAPEMQEATSELQTVESRIEERLGELIDSYRNRQELLVGQRASLQAQMDRIKQENFASHRKASEYDIATSEADTKRRIYDSVIQTVEQIGLQSSLLHNNLAVLDEAVVPKNPIKPRTRLNLFMGTMLGLMLGVGAAFFLDYIDNTIKSPDDIENLLKLHLLSVIPRYRESTSHAVREAYQTLRTSVLFSSRGREKRILLVTSAGPREGKTSTLVNLARTIASAGEKVVAIDCDLRRPKVHEDLGLEREPGLTNYLAGMGATDYREFLKPTSSPNLWCLTCGPIPPNPPELFGSKRFKELLTELRNDFDWVLIDSPPVVSLTDAVILASMAEMVAFVVRHNENDRDIIKRCVTSIRKVNPNVIGAVLNSVDIERGGDYYYAGYYYYGYGKEEQGKGRKKGGRRSRRDERVGAAR